MYSQQLLSNENQETSSKLKLPIIRKSPIFSLMQPLMHNMHVALLNTLFRYDKYFKNKILLGFLVLNHTMFVLKLEWVQNLFKTNTKQNIYEQRTL